MRLVVWGTDVNVQETKTRFRQFLETFDVQNEDEAPLVENQLPLYMQRLEEVSVVYRLLSRWDGVMKSPCSHFQLAQMKFFETHSAWKKTL